MGSIQDTVTTYSPYITSVFDTMSGTISAAMELINKVVTEVLTFVVAGIQAFNDGAESDTVKSPPAISCRRAAACLKSSLYRS